MTSDRFSWLRSLFVDSTNGSVPICRKGLDDPLFQEHVKTLRAKFENRINLYQAKIIAVTSSIAGEGKTFSCIKLAESLVASGAKKVLLVDADMRKGDLTQGLELEKAPGLSDYLLGAASLGQVVRTSDKIGSFVISSGTEVASPSDLFFKDRLPQLIGEMRKAFDVVLIDTPPVVPISDMITLREKVDGVIVLYRAGVTPIGMLRQTVEEIGLNKIFGVVINGVDQKSKRYYDRYYGNYYRQVKKPS